MNADVEIVEHVSGVWSYHLAPTKHRISLCEKSGMMPTSMKLESWGRPCPNTSVHYKWCRECERLASWCPKPGDTVILLVSTLAREIAREIVRESLPRKVIWEPLDKGSLGRVQSTVRKDGHVFVFASFPTDKYTYECPLAALRAATPEEDAAARLMG